MARGWVYVMTNEAMPNLVKVGFTLKDTELRAQELSTTGVPGKWVVKYEAFVVNPRAVEQHAHNLLHEFSFSKEFFSCSVKVAIAALENAATDSYHLKDQEDSFGIDDDEKLGKYSGIWFDGFTGNGFYDGQVLNGNRHGLGRFVAQIGKKIYEGEWKNNVFDGLGVLELDKERYDGIWRHGEFEHGVVFKYVTAAEVYQGEWRYGARNGNGKLTGRLGETYDGSWKDDQRHGFGKQVYPNGRFYTGEWKNDEPNGLGKLTNPSGEILDGEWLHGEFCGDDSN